MGKRKSSSKPQGPKRKDALPTQFTCLFCNHERAVHVKLDKKTGIGTLECKTCGQRFQSTINYLSAAVDVYGDWVDAADSVAKEQTGAKASIGGGGRGRASKTNARNDYDDDIEEDYEGEEIMGDEDIL